MFIQICKKCNRIGRITDSPMIYKTNYKMILRDNRYSQGRHMKRCFPEMKITFEDLEYRMKVIKSRS